MATVQQIITGALRKLGAVQSNEEPSAEDIDLGLTALNDMCNAWSAQDIHTGFSTVAAADLATEFILDARHHGAVKAMLAEYLSPDFGDNLPAQVKKQAYDGFLALRADYRPIDTLRMDAGLQAMPSQRIYW